VFTRVLERTWSKQGFEIIGDGTGGADACDDDNCAI
jgi:hypothetical protein